MVAGPGGPPRTASPPVRDPGRQPDRTLLAWRRTSLAVVAGGLVAVRLLPPVLGRTGLVVAVALALSGAVLALLAARRGRQVDRLVARGAAPPGAGGLTLVLAAAVAVAAGLGVLVVLLPAPV